MMNPLKKYRQNIEQHSAHNLFSQEFNAVFVGEEIAKVKLPIASQVPSIHYLNSTVRKGIITSNADILAFSPSKCSVTQNLSSLLRFTHCPSGDRCAFLASAHNVSNVVSGSGILLYHSVKHYETKAMIGLAFIVEMISFICYFAAKVARNTETARIKNHFVTISPLRL